MQDMRTPLRIAAMMVGLNLVLNLTLVWSMRESGLALASSISSAGNVILLWAALRKKLGPLGGRAVMVSAAKCAIAAALAGVAAHFAVSGLRYYFAASHPLTSEFATQLLVLLGGLAAAAVSFFAIAWLLRTRELHNLLALRRRRRGNVRK